MRACWQVCVGGINVYDAGGAREPVKLSLGGASAAVLGTHRCVLVVAKLDI